MECLQHEVVSCGQCFLLSKHFSLLSRAGGKGRGSPASPPETQRRYTSGGGHGGTGLCFSVPHLCLFLCSSLHTARERPKTTDDRHGPAPAPSVAPYCLWTEVGRPSLPPLPSSYHASPLEPDQASGAQHLSRSSLGRALRVKLSLSVMSKLPRFPHPRPSPDRPTPCGSHPGAPPTLSQPSFPVPWPVVTPAADLPASTGLPWWSRCGPLSLSEFCFVSVKSLRL